MTSPEITKLNELQMQIKDALVWAYREGRACACFEIHPNEHSKDHYEWISETASEKEYELIKAFAADNETPPQAKPAKITAYAAIRYLTREYHLDAPGQPRSYTHEHGGKLYRVTVAGADHFVDANKMVPADAEPAETLADLEKAVDTLVSHNIGVRATNYTTHTVQKGDKRFSVTVQREGGITPSEEITRLRHEIAELKTLQSIPAKYKTAITRSEYVTDRLKSLLRACIHNQEQGQLHSLEKHVREFDDLCRDKIIELPEPSEDARNGK